MTVGESISLDFRVLAEGLSFPVCLLSREGIVLSLNRPAVTLLGKDSLEAIVGCHLREFCFDSSSVDTLVSRWARSTQRTPGLLTIVSEDEQVVTCRCSGTAIGLGGSEAQFILVECLPKDRHPGRFAALNRQLEELREELSKRTQLEAERSRLLELEQRARAEAERAVVQKDEFLGMMSHELRTPITTIYGNAFLLKNNRDRLSPEFQAEALEDIYNESERLRAIIENLLVLARLDTSRSPLPETVSLKEKLEQIAADFSRSHPHRQLLLSLEPGLPPRKLVPAYIEMIVTNLLSNANKYSPPDKPVELRLERTEHEFVVSVLDEGIGLQPDEAEAIFQPFFRSPRTQQLAGGVGLGLSVCKRLTEYQGGTVSALPRSGGGSVFSLSFPL